MTFQSQAVPLSRQARMVGVFRYTPTPDGADQEDQETYQFLPNVRCLNVQYRVGADPGTAQFRYAFDPLLGPQFPQRANDVLGLAATGPYVVKQDDRLVVRVYHDDGSYLVFFDGFALTPQGNLDRRSEVVTFTAIGAPIRCWDKPLQGALVRDASKPATAGADVRTHLRAEFNPSGRPNASPKNADSGTSPQQWPVFLGPIWPPTGTDPANNDAPICQINGQTLRAWTLGMAARYVILTGSLKPDGKSVDETYVTFGDMSNLDDGLSTVAPKVKGGEVDLSDPTTYTLEPIEVVDYDVGGEAWPVALERLITPHGFQMRFDIQTDQNGDPLWRLYLYREDVNTNVKPLQLQAVAATVDPAQTNVGDTEVVCDSNGIENQFTLDSALTRHEISVCCAPLFQLQPSDADDPTQFAGSTSEKYRVFGMDECGEGHWDVDKAVWSTGKPGDLSTVFNPPQKKGQKQGAAPKQPFVVRRRPALPRLVSLDDDQKPLRPQLHVSSNYQGPVPGLWDGTGTWQEIDSDDWHSLPDRLGFKITAPDPNSWAILSPSKEESGTIAYQNSPGRINLVEWLVKPSAAFPFPIFRFTCVVEADRGLDAKSPKRAASPTQFARERRIDARDRFHKSIVTRYSALADKPGPDQKDQAPAIDDTAEAQAQSDGMQRAHELPKFAGKIMIPRISTAYQLGDKIDRVQGRDLSFQQNAAAEQNETQQYPTVVAISYELDGKQSTTLQLSDRRAEPPPKHRESRDD